MLTEFLQKAIINGNKSTILLPLSWLIGLTFSACLIAAFIKAPQWMIIMFAVILALTILLFLYAFIYSLHKNPDNLRSEKYTIQKMAIEKGVIGDDVTGIINIKTKEDVKSIKDIPLKTDDSES